MKLITVIIIGVFTITSAIRVPASWPEQKNLQQKHHKFRTNHHSVGSEIGFRSRPHVGQMQKYNKINSGRKYQESRHRNLKKPQVKKEFKASAPLGDWKPVFPQYMLQQSTQVREPTIQKHNKFEKNSPLYKNYRDDKTHEPRYETIEETHIHKEKPLSNQELPQDIPTRPIYPGEGRWAIKGVKHRPYVPKQQYQQPEEKEEEEEPEGYDTFQKNKALFDRQKSRFRQNINQFSQKHKFAAIPQHENQEEEEEEEEEEQQFVPMRVYTQVRRTENQEHLPQLAEDPRLREVIKDSKIQTVYTEEGYEDLAYDHAGHEKTAEEDEGYAEFDKEIEKEKLRRQKAGDNDSAGSHHQVVKKPLRMKKDKLVKTKEVKTMSVKDQNSGNSELEVLSEIKILETPENGTKTHKFVKITPKMYEEVPTTTPKETETISTTTAPEYRRRFRRRYKRYTDFSIDTSFIDKINHNLPQVPKVREKPKYPYYNDPNINPYSPLRYAEDLDNIPKKTEDDLAFYHQADKKVECKEVETDVNPIPARVKEADEDPENVEDATDIQELVKMPRLKGLGDKIDCFKVKYFGENPLDSPFFSEKDIGAVPPLFKLPQKSNKEDIKINETGEKPSYSNRVTVHQVKTKLTVRPKPEIKTEDLHILADVIKQFNKSEATTVQPTQPTSESEKVNQTEASVISIITTPKYTIDLKPKHIYHQIELLSYLPYYNNTNLDNKTTNAPPVKRVGKILTEPTTEATPTEQPPESQALIHRRRRPRPRRPPYQIFDVNRYLPKHSFNLLNRIIRTSTVLPKRGATSEVYYKDEINASEQLNVFADVINNIKSSGKDGQTASSNRIATTVDFYNHRKIPVVETDLDDIEETNSFYMSTTTVPPRGTIKYTSYLTKDDRDTTKYENLELLKVKKRLTTTTESDTGMSSSSNEEEVEEPEKEEEEEEPSDSVVGLMPPVPPNQYTTIIKPQLTKPKEAKTNIFYVFGMKPPSLKQKTYLYSDFKRYQKTRNPHLRRGKRSAQRPIYSEVVRNRNKPIDVQDDTEVVVEDDDDYVPHRPKNYHYDEKTGKIVYVNVKKETEAPEEEYIEVTEAPIPKPTRRNSAPAPAVRFKNFTGPSFVEFVKKLKADATYEEIPDPPSTEKGEEIVTTTSTTVKPVSTQPPEFLGFLSKLRSDSNYKALPDKTTKKTTTTTEVALEEDQEETQLENVKNSPGGQSVSQRFQIFDINEYLPKIKTYTPRTSIDYSKYKTIERSHLPLRHNLSSRYNSEDMDSVKTSRVPIVMDDKREQTEVKEINPETSESKREEVEPSTTSTTTTTTTQVPLTSTTRRVRTRPKTRGTLRTTSVPAATTASVTEESSTVPPSKPKRVFPRRRPTRIKINRATEVRDAEIEQSASAKVVRRRYKKSEDVSEVEKQVDTSSPEPQISKKDGDVQVFRKYDRSKKHGGNYGREKKEEETENKESETKNDNITRLTDIISKPSTYYSDPKLPKKINQLMEGEGDVDVEEGEEEKSEDQEGEGAEFDYGGVEDKTTTTKKPIFVKDPEKRLYYYAPI